MGLHTCGDLAPTLLRVFAQSRRVAAVVSVGCCYMKLTSSSMTTPLRSATPTSAANDHFKPNQHAVDTPTHSKGTPTYGGVPEGYPMSHFLREEWPHPLSYGARELACHAVDIYRERLINGWGYMSTI